VADKPAYLMRNEKFHRARQPEGFPTIQDALEIFAEYVGWHSRQPHKGLDGGLPIEKFLAGKGEGVDPAVLDHEFMWRKEVRPRRCRIRLAGIDFESDALYGLDQPILVYYAWNDLSEIRMYVKRTGQYLGLARPVRALHPVARHLGSDLDLVQVQEANKRQARLKKQTMQLAREADAPESALNILPWVGIGERVLLESKEPARQEEPTPVEISDSDRRAIEQIQRDWEARKAAAPPYECPDFAKPLDRYSFLFDLKVFQGIDLLPEDAAFMAEYQAGREYREVTHRRFEQLLKLRDAQIESESEPGKEAAV
jgi:putative transposase